MGTSDLLRLKRWLSYELSSPVLLLAWFVIPGLSVLALVVAALAITPFLVRTLYRRNRKGWIWAFALFVGLPAVLALIPVASPVVGFVLRFLPLVTFLLYCWALRHQVSEWLEEIRWSEEERDLVLEA